MMFGVTSLTAEAHLRATRAVGSHTSSPAPPWLADTRIKMAIPYLRFLHDHHQQEDLARQYLVMDEVQFWLDCSTMAAVISEVQTQAPLDPTETFQ